MRGPFASALSAIPWPTILKQAPALLAAADALIARSRQPVAPTAATDVQALRQRIAELEAQQQADADLVKQLADQLAAVAIAAQLTSVRVRQAFVLAAAGVGLGLIACVLLWWQWNW